MIGRHHLRCAVNGSGVCKCGKRFESSRINGFDSWEEHTGTALHRQWFDRSYGAYKSLLAPAPRPAARRKQPPKVRKTPSCPEVGPTLVFYSCIPTGVHGLPRVFWANLTPFSPKGPGRWTENELAHLDAYHDEHWEGSLNCGLAGATYNDASRW